MAGLDPANQMRSRLRARKTLFGAQARRMGGRLEAGHDDFLNLRAFRVLRVNP